ncbi:MAG: LysM peptidoglycan-binding domain-containing protein [Candidatus Cryptobacteroides sp.]
MTKLKVFTAVAAAAMLFAVQPVSASEAVNPAKKKTKTALVKENERMAKQIDSLKAALASITDEMEGRDSLATEIMDMYEEGNRLRPEDYNAEVTDSLLSIWYLHNAAREDYTPEYDLDSVRFSSNVPDSVYIRRIKEMNSYITLPYNDIVKNYIILYSEKLKNINKILGLCKYYMPIFESTFNKYDMPEELKAMAVIESALNPVAVSRAGAKGMWQFMYQTAKNYGLKINSFVDERMDVEKAADAAARYLMDSYKIFGDWNLAIASYNCGAGNVNKAIRRSGGKMAFWDIYPYLPRETRGYVPAFVGALYTMNYYKEHGIVPEVAAMPPAVDTFKINKMLHFKQVEELVGIPMEQIRNLNPQYRHDIVPGNEAEYVLRLPFNYSNKFIDAGDSLYRYKAEELFNPVTIKKIQDGGDGQRIIYKVKSGDNLGKIAARHRTTVAKIKKWNGLRSDNIRVGQRLVIYTGNAAPASTSSSSSSSSTKTSSTSQTKTSSASSQTTSSNTGYTVYTVKQGDTLYEIAKKYPGISAKNIMDYNKIGSNIRPGMKLKIPKK